MNIPQGLYYNREFITPEFERSLIDEIYSQQWNEGLEKSLNRRTQHYEHYYEYSKPTQRRKAKPMPPTIKKLADLIYNYGIIDKMPDQVLINEYERNEGISAHSDHPQFGERVVIVSLWAPALMHFTRGSNSIDLVLEPRSMAMMMGEARHEWKHEIDGRVTIKSGSWSYTKPKEYRRISVTYRYYK